MNLELSWRAVVIIVTLAVLGVVCSLLGEKTLGGSLVGGALGYLAQGFGPGRKADGSAVPTELPPMESSKRFSAAGGGGGQAARIRVVGALATVGLVLVLLLVGW